jgi:hypothetical protein
MLRAIGDVGGKEIDDCDDDIAVFFSMAAIINFLLQNRK